MFGSHFKVSNSNFYCGKNFALKGELYGPTFPRAVLKVLLLDGSDYNSIFWSCFKSWAKNQSSFISKQLGWVIQTINKMLVENIRVRPVVLLSWSWIKLVKLFPYIQFWTFGNIFIKNRQLISSGLLFNGIINLILLFPVI